MSLNDSSLRIGSTAALIRTIARQTHLLALNATIGAADAGEAGRVFAVVANEVKTLAQTTSQSTEETADLVGTMQGSVAEAIDVMAKLATAIRGIDSSQNFIAHAVEEQTNTASAMRNDTVAAAEALAAITTNIESVAESAALTTEGITAAQRSAIELAGTATDLAALSESFHD